MNKKDASLLARMDLDLPDRMAGNLRVEHFNVGDDIEDMIRSNLHYGSRMPAPGTYIRLMETVSTDSNEDVVWMSNTPAELEDHLPVMRRASQPDVRKVLVTGLGLGCVTRGLASFEHIEQIDVIEYNADVIILTSEQFAYDERIAVHHASAYTFPVRKQHWDLAWHDIWPEISTHNLPEMHELYTHYRGHARIQGFWALNLCVKQWELEKDLFDLVKAKEGRYPGAGHMLLKPYHAHKEEGKYAYRLPIDPNTNLENK